MSVTVPTVDVGDVRDKRGGDYEKTFEDRNEDYIKLELGLEK